MCKGTYEDGKSFSKRKINIFYKSQKRSTFRFDGVKDISEKGHSKDL